MRLKFTGDLSLNGRYSNLIETNEDPFMDVADFFKNSDLNITNLEAVCESPDQLHHAKTTRLSIAPGTLIYLKTIKTHLVTLANNHVYDNLQGGLNLTLGILEKMGIDYVGASRSTENNYPFVCNVKGKKIAFLNYVHSLTHPGVKESDSIKLNIYNKSSIIKEIKRLKEQNDYVILILHWGQDNSRYPAPWQRKDAKAFAEAGASLIIGHHSHVLQGYETFGHTKVFYSLGNFAFSPLRESEELDRDRQIETVILDVDIQDQKIDFSIIPVKLFGLYPKPVKDSGFYKYSTRLKFVSNVLVYPFYLAYLNLVYKIYFYFFGNDRNFLSQVKKIDKRRLIRLSKIIFKFRN